MPNRVLTQVGFFQLNLARVDNQELVISNLLPTNNPPRLNSYSTFYKHTLKSTKICFFYKNFYCNIALQ
ncbi:hypothetical protein A3K33_01580 [Candidatus Azambacteria bacterium RIFOXYC1_FULL_41_20]|nr:MAG: hypothetical protein A3K33_01580 [Candidatus Azambacteria bacterium RIFOXYC1_FULL_41_20]OGD47500.1 MAG: hypothetical protein A3K35_01580 [Candidatus Azambacteria bacterium RIFOXYD1_FULL_42_38]